MKIWLHVSSNKFMSSRVNSSFPSAAYMRQWTGSALVQIMACRLFGNNSLSKPMLGCCQLEPLGTNFNEIWIKIHNVSFRKMHLKMKSAKWRPFCPGGDELNAHDCCLNRMCERDTETGVNPQSCVIQEQGLLHFTTRQKEIYQVEVFHGPVSHNQGSKGALPKQWSDEHLWSKTFWTLIFSKFGSPCNTLCVKFG